MFEIKMNELSLDKLHRIAIKLPINRNHILYKDSYNALIQFSKPLKDFIYESNKGRDIFFVSSEEDAIEKLSRT